jgi:histidine triad (HIT) family protein
MTEACVFCRIVAGDLPSQVVHETESTLAFRDAAPLAPTHVLVVTRRHFSDLTEAASIEPSVLGELMAAATSVAAAAGLSAGFRLVVNTGHDGGQTVGHLHLHVLGGRQLGLLG